MQRCIHFFYIIVVTFSITVAMSSAVSAQENRLQFGKIAILPIFNISQIYDTNIFREEDNEQADFITVVQPGIGVVRESADGSFLGASYDATMNLYYENHEINYTKHHARLEGAYNFLTSFYVKGSSDFTFTADPEGNDNLFGENQFNIYRWFNNAALAVGYDSYKFGAELSYNNYYLEYLNDEDSNENTMRHTLGLTLRRRVLPKTSITAGLRTTLSVYPVQNSGDNSEGATSSTSQDGILYEALVGVEFDATAKVTGELKGGVGYKDFLNERNFNGRLYEDTFTWLLQGNLGYALSEKTNLSLLLEHSLRDSSDNDFTSFTVSRAALTLEQILFQRWLFTIQPVFEYRDFIPVSSADARTDVLFGGLVSLEYSLREWCVLGVNYEYRQRTSSDETAEFERHRTGLNVSIEY